MTTPEPDTKNWVPKLATFGARLAAVRHHMGWNIKEAATACGVPAQSWRGWELDGREPHRQVTIALAIAGRTGCDVDWLLGLDRPGVRTSAYGRTRVLLAAERSAMTPEHPSRIGHLDGTRPVRQTRPLVGVSLPQRERVSV
jgi:transcriptional regulator with XRE-family HTH domain